MRNGQRMKCRRGTSISHFQFDPQCKKQQKRIQDDTSTAYLAAQLDADIYEELGLIVFNHEVLSSFINSASDLKEEKQMEVEFDEAFTGFIDNNKNPFNDDEVDDAPHSEDDKATKNDYPIWFNAGIKRDFRIDSKDSTVRINTEDPFTASSDTSDEADFNDWTDDNLHRKKSTKSKAGNYGFGSRLLEFLPGWKRTAPLQYSS
eukprot:Plantae.Rhodophyta-Palmaria_palmata.ctg11850.p3 GENE.Plantae.Rhodophyta-Palmaria_palmata.ctg11850~~Plantae.Rhodophyta-Palmaria_palmata.ctg11850.p3  ORF type:complete len:204 (-),score=22.68 Plantae.Rhodophyta-Palmaria_palmata.ctg11850:803-1414(-)